MSETTVQPQTDAAAIDALVEADRAKAMPDMANLLQARSDAMIELSLLGEKAAQGSGSLLEAAWFMADKCGERLLSVGAGKSAGGDDAEHAYLAYAMGHNAANVSGVDPLPVDPKEGAKHSISIFRTFGAAGKLGATSEFYAKRVLPLFRAVDKDERYGSAYNTLVRINRALVKDSLHATQSPVVTDEWLDALCRKDAKADKSALEKLKPAVDAILRAYKSGVFAGIDEPALKLEAWFGKAIADAAAETAKSQTTAGTVH